jgi:hypothetical protein
VKPKKIPTSVSEWFGKFGGWELKSCMMLEPTFPWPIDESFQPLMFEVLMCLRTYFPMYTLKAMNSKLNWSPDEAYDRFMDVLNDAIKGFEDT